MRILPRNVWAADIKPGGTPSRIPLPAPRLWLHHGASGTSTIQTARAYAKYHIYTRGWTDVGYSFLIAEGQVLEGRGPGRQGAHTSGDNANSHGICMVGRYDSRPPSDEDLDALKWLLSNGAEQGWWRTAQLSGGHRDAPGASTSCPGTALHKLIPELNAPTDEDEMPSIEDIRQVVRDEIGRVVVDHETGMRLDTVLRHINGDTEYIRRRIDYDNPKVRRGLRGLLNKLGVSVTEGP